GPKNTIAALTKTAGKLVWYQNRIVTTYFASSSGGYTMEFGCWGNRVVKSGDTWICTPDATQPYLKALPDPADRAVSNPTNRHASWTATFTGSEIRQKLLTCNGIDIGVLQGVDVSNQSPPGVGHVISIRFIGTARTADVKAESFLRSCLGLKSTMLRLARLP
ncbi:MAG: hypothetical protein AAB131_01400, partial [Actinomycetota bacterium]